MSWSQCCHNFLSTELLLSLRQSSCSYGIRWFAEVFIVSGLAFNALDDHIKSRHTHTLTQLSCFILFTAYNSIQHHVVANHMSHEEHLITSSKKKKIRKKNIIKHSLLLLSAVVSIIKKENKKKKKIIVTSTSTTINTYIWKKSEN